MVWFVQFKNEKTTQKSQHVCVCCEFACSPCVLPQLRDMHLRLTFVCQDRLYRIWFSIALDASINKSNNK